MANAALAGAGPNFGWDVEEGDLCNPNDPAPSPDCESPALTPPLHTYAHEFAGGCSGSVVGGYVHRGDVAALAGKYVFGDTCQGFVRTLEREPGGESSSKTCPRTSRTGSRRWSRSAKAAPASSTPWTGPPARSTSSCPNPARRLRRSPRSRRSRARHRGAARPAGVGAPDRDPADLAPGVADPPTRLSCPAPQIQTRLPQARPSRGDIGLAGVPSSRLGLAPKAPTGVRWRRLAKAHSRAASPGERRGSELAVVILAAGQGKRMKSGLVKVLHELGGRPMLAYSIDVARAQEPERLVVVIGRDAERVEAAFAGRATFVLQAERKGTGHAVLQARDALAGFSGDVLILYGDTPLLRAETLARMRAEKARRGVDRADPLRDGAAARPHRARRAGPRAAHRRDHRRDARGAAHPGRQHGHVPRRRRVPAGRRWIRSTRTTRRARSISPTSSASPCAKAAASTRSRSTTPTRRSASTRAPSWRAPRRCCGAARAARVMDEGVTLVDPDATYLDWDVRDRPRHRDRAGLRDPGRDPHRRALLDQGAHRDRVLDARRRRRARPVGASAARRAARDGRADRQLRRGEEQHARRRREGRPSLLHRRRRRRRGRELRLRLGRRELRRREQAPHDGRSEGLRRLQREPHRAGDDRGRTPSSRRARRSPSACRRIRSASRGRARRTSRAGACAPGKQKPGKHGKE